MKKALHKDIPSFITDPWESYREDPFFEVTMDYRGKKERENIWKQKRDRESLVSFIDDMAYQDSIVDDAGTWKIISDAIDEYLEENEGDAHIWMLKAKSLEMIASGYLGDEDDESAIPLLKDALDILENHETETNEEWGLSNTGDRAEVLADLAVAYLGLKKYREAEFNQIRSLDIRKSELEKGERPEKLAKLGEEYDSLATIYASSEKYDDAEEAAMTAASYMERAFIVTDDLRCVSHRFNYTHHAATLRFMSGCKLEKAVEHYEEGIKLIEYLIEETRKEIGDETAIPHRKIAEIYNEIAMVLLEMGRAEESLATYHKALELSKKNYRKWKEQEDLDMLAQTEDWIGDWYGNHADIENARNWYAHSLNTRSKIKQRSVTADMRATRMMTNKKLALIYRAEGNTTKALCFLDQALKDARWIEKHSDIFMKERWLASTYSDIAEVYEDKSDWIDAEHYYDLALPVNKRLVREEKSIDNLSEYSDNIDGLGFCRFNLQDYEKAEKYYRQCYDLNVDLLEKTGDIEEKRALALTERQLGLIEYHNDRFGQAKKFLSSALKRQAEVMHESETEEDRLTYGDIYIELDEVPSETISIPSVQRD